MFGYSPSPSLTLTVARALAPALTLIRILTLTLTLPYVGVGLRGTAMEELATAAQAEVAGPGRGEYQPDWDGSRAQAEPAVVGTLSRALV